MKIKIGINGMGRIGRMILRSIYEGNKKIEVMHINNRTNSETCSTLLKYDSIHGKFNAELKVKKDNNQPTKIKTSGSTFKNPKNKTKKKSLGVNQGVHSI